MKRGASHVDWAISMGLFLVFIMLTLIFLRPGTEPIYKGETIIKIMEDGLKEDGYYTVNKQFLVIEPTSISNGEYEIRLRNPTQKGLNTHWKMNKEHLGLVNSSLGTVPSEELLYIPFDLDDEYCNINPANCLDDVLDIETYLVNGKKNIFWFLYSEDMNYPQHDVVIDSLSNPEEGCFKTGTCLLDEENFTYKFGVLEILKGFSEEKLYQISNESGSYDYTALKDAWNVPKDKNFRVSIKNLTAYEEYQVPDYEDGITFFAGFEEIGQIPPQMSVFAKEWKTWMLTPKGRLIPVEVHMELW